MRGRLSRILGLVVTVIFIFNIFTSLMTSSLSVSDEGWWNRDWPFRKAIIIDHTQVEDDLRDFPVLIDITSSRLATVAQSDGDDIVFTDSSGQKLSHEIELYDSRTGQLVAWVKLSTLSSTTDTLVYLYYGNPSVGNQEDSFGVWDLGFMMIQHLNEKSGVHYDSTSHGNDGVSYGVIQGATGKIDGADIFDGTSSYIEIPHDNSVTGFTEAFTVSFWIKPSENTNRQCIVNKYNTANKGGGWFIEYRPYGKIVLFASPDGVHYKRWYCRGKLTPDEWYHVAVVWQANAIPRFYINGREARTAGSDTIPKIHNNDGVPLHIGKSTYNSRRMFKGAIDEVRISNVARSADWVATSFNNQRDPSSFYTIGGEQEYSPTLRSLGESNTPTVEDENPTDGSTNVYTNPELSVTVTGDGLMDIFFRTNASGTWEDIGNYTNGASGTYSVIPTSMNQLGTKYYWMVCATDGVWTNETYSFTTTDTVFELKWTTPGLAGALTGVLIADVTGDETEEVIWGGFIDWGLGGEVTVLDGVSGDVVWSRIVEEVDQQQVALQIADLNRDGLFEIVVPVKGGIVTLHGNDGSSYWNSTGWTVGTSSAKSPCVVDIDGDGYPEIFHGTSVYSLGLDAGSRITALSYDGQVLYQSFSYRPCAGGVSVADTDGDGEPEVYTGDRHMYMSTSYGKGCRSFWARNLTLRWEHPDILMSSQVPIIADVDEDGILDIIVSDESGAGGIAVLNSVDGSAIKKELDIWIIDSTGGRNRLPVCDPQGSVYDIDGDGNLEFLLCDLWDSTSDDLVIWDLVDWKLDAIIYSFQESGQPFQGPQIADVTGDGKMDMIVCADKGIYIYTYNSTSDTYDLVDKWTGLTGVDTLATVGDIDGDGYNELVAPSKGGVIRAFDTPARTPNPRPRSEVQYYSERRLSAAEYVPHPGRPEPIISDPSPANGEGNVSVSLSDLSFKLTDYTVLTYPPLEYEKMNYSVVTYPDIVVGSGSGINVSNGIQTVSVEDLTYSTTYTWQVNVTDGVHSESKTFTFTTEPEPLSEGAPRILNENPSDGAHDVPVSLSQLNFSLIDFEGDSMNYTVVTYPNIVVSSGSGINVSDGVYTISVGGLAYSTTYTWQVNVTDGVHWNKKTYTFTTATSTPPTHDEPALDMTDDDLVCRNQTTLDLDGDAVTNIYNWYKNGISRTSLLMPFDTNDEATAKDYSGYGNDGTVVRATWTSNGVVGGAYYFSGDHPGGGHIKVPHSSRLDGDGEWSEMTVEHWVYLMRNDPYSGDETRTIAKVPSYEIRIDNRRVYVGVWIPRDPPNQYYARYYSTGGYYLTYNRWYHIAFTYKSGDRLRLYVNGVQRSSISLSGNIQRSSGKYSGLEDADERGYSIPLYIGWFDHFHGMIDEVKIYPNCLSAEQINQNYLETKDGASNNSTIVPQETEAGEVWKCEVTPNDAHYDGTARMSNTLTVGNRPPRAENLILGPRARDTALTTDTLVGSYDYFDWDGDPESGTEIRWYRNGVLQPGQNDNLEVPSSLTAPGDVWYFTVRPSDGIDFGSLRTSVSVTIVQNSPPTHDDPALKKVLETDPTTENLVGYNQTTMDPDGSRDEVTNVYSWYRNGIQWANLLMPFDTENWTEAKDYSSYGNDGTVDGSTWTEDGVVGGAYEFDGDDIITVADDPSLGGDGTWSEITVEFWVRVAAPLHGTRIVAKKVAYASTGSYMVGFQTSTSDPANTLFWGVTINGAWEEVIYYGEPLEVNVWYHVVCTYKSGPGLTLYLNGTGRINKTFEGNIEYDTPSPGDEPLFIGSSGEADPGRYLIGTLDEVRIYPRCLSAEQILQRYLETKDGDSSSSTIVWEETSAGDIWRCEVVPSDSYVDGESRLSNEVTVFSVPTTLFTSFDVDASPVVVDDSGYGNNGTVHGATWIDYGAGGGSYYFDGGGDYIQVPDDSSLDGDGEFSEVTVELWVFPTANQAGTIILEKGANFSHRSYQVGFLRSENANILFCAVWADDYYEVQYDVPLERYVWYHVAFTYNGSMLTLYINGLAVGSVAGSGNLRASSNHPIYIGARYGTRDFFEGLVDEVMICPVSLSAEQILQHYLNP